MAHRTYHPYYVAELEAALDAKDAEILKLQYRNALLRANKIRSTGRLTWLSGLGLPPVKPSAGKYHSGLAALAPAGASQ